MYVVSQQGVGSALVFSGASAPNPVSSLRWTLELYHKSGGLKKSWALGQDNCPVISIDFEENLLGCGSGTIGLAYIDFPIDIDDYVLIYFNGKLKYRGMINVTPDPEGGEIELIPQHFRLEELLYNGSFTSKTIAEISATVIAAIKTDADIQYSASLIDTNSSDTISPNYQYESAKKIITDLMERIPTRYYGVRADRFFYIKSFSEVRNNDLFYTDNSAYSDISVEQNNDGIDATHYQVYKKASGASGSEYVGQVGYGGLYPEIPLLTISRKKEKKLTVSEVLSVNEALEYAYAKLLTMAVERRIEIKNIDLDQFEPVVGNLIRVQAQEKETIQTIIDCDSLTNWTGATLDTTDYIENTASITATIENIGDGVSYSFGAMKNYKAIQKFGFMLKSDYSGNILDITISYGQNMSDYVVGAGVCGAGECGINAMDESQTESAETITNNSLNISSSNIWQLFEFEATSGLYKIEWALNQDLPVPAIINIDRIHIYNTDRLQYEDNVVSIKYKITPANENITVQLSSYNFAANQKLFEFDKKISILEAVIAV
jgi:hypothetical protein